MAMAAIGNHDAAGAAFPVSPVGDAIVMIGNLLDHPWRINRLEEEAELQGKHRRHDTELEVGY